MLSLKIMRINLDSFLKHDNLRVNVNLIRTINSINYCMYYIVTGLTVIEF